MEQRSGAPWHQTTQKVAFYLWFMSKRSPEHQNTNILVNGGGGVGSEEGHSTQVDPPTIATHDTPVTKYNCRFSDFTWPLCPALKGLSNF